MRSLWLPFLPDSAWQTEAPRREGTTQVYLDVSGSMNAEMPQIIALLARLSTLHPPAVLGVQHDGRRRR